MFYYELILDGLLIFGFFIKGKDKCSYILYIVANSVQGKVNEDHDNCENTRDLHDSKSFSNKSSSKENKDIDFTDMDLMFFDELRNGQLNVFKFAIL
jgi:hypothetical protein